MAENFRGGKELPQYLCSPAGSKGSVHVQFDSTHSSFLKKQKMSMGVSTILFTSHRTSSRPLRSTYLVVLFIRVPLFTVLKEIVVTQICLSISTYVFSLLHGGRFGDPDETSRSGVNIFTPLSIFLLWIPEKKGKMWLVFNRPSKGCYLKGITADSVTETRGSG